VVTWTKVLCVYFNCLGTAYCTYKLYTVSQLGNDFLLCCQLFFKNFLPNPLKIPSTAWKNLSAVLKLHNHVQEIKILVGKLPTKLRQLIKRRKTGRNYCHGTIVKGQFGWANAIIISLRFTTARVRRVINTNTNYKDKLKFVYFLYLMQCCGTGTVTFCLSRTGTETVIKWNLKR
jgi:hypothetical protein